MADFHSAMYLYSDEAFDASDDLLEKTRIEVEIMSKQLESIHGPEYNVSKN